ncbi:GTPase [Cellulomonas hominis]
MSEPTPGPETGGAELHRPRRQLAGQETVALGERVERIEQALALGGARIDPAVAARITIVVDRVRERLELGVDHTVVALLGGTGSGKSSLFNAVSGLEFADVGVKRPTTAEVTACVWGTEGAELLDWLGVGADRRIERESALDGDTEAPLRGLVLLDLPDHDSIEPKHREVVDRLLPMADLLVWVVDPQKYADDALHSGYLQRLVGHEAVMVVVLNQVDTVPGDVRDELVADVHRLLADDGLTGVPVRVASARTGEGVPEMRDMLAEVVARRSIAAQRAAAEVNDAATLLAGQVADREPDAQRLAVDDVVDVLARAAGLPAIADAVAAVVRGGATSVPSFGDVQPDTVGLARADWLAAVTPSVPPRWQEAIGARVATTEVLRAQVNSALGRVAVAARRSVAAGWAFGIALVLGLCGLGAVSIVAGMWLGGASGREGVTSGAAYFAVGLVVGAVLAVVLGFVVRRSAARRRSAAVLRDGRSSLAAVARELLAEPTAAVLDEHRRVRELTAASGGA